MKFILDIFSKPPEMLISDIQKKKGYYAGLVEYYRGKVEFLSKKGIDGNLLNLVSKDAPSNLRGKIQELGKDTYRKRCLEHYEEKLKTVKAELKKIDRIKVKH